MKDKRGTTHITPSNGNVFADLGFPAKEAAALLAETDRIIDQKLAIKDKLMTEISGWIKKEHLTQDAAAKILGCSRPRVSDIVQKKSPNFTIDSLVAMLARAGKDVRVSIAARR